ncbi:MAG: hypothetical protein JW967_08260 [Dehalococcoidales bacterium]|nr:hypothetical protein [Dehalococcoidales bacterium]
MIHKTVWILNIENLPNEYPAFERWYIRHHSPEAVGGFYGSLVRYIGFHAVPTIPEVKPYGFYNWRVTEMYRRSEDEAMPEGRPANSPATGGVRGGNYWLPNQEERQGVGGISPYETKWYGGPKLHQNVQITVPAQPTEDFLPPQFYYNDMAPLRWYIATKYPDGVSVEEGEDWFLNVHSKEVLKQPGLIRYFSARALPSPFPWVRLTEQWYENFGTWKKAVIDSPPKYTKPPWAKYDKYPFLEPYVDFVSSFILTYPTNDFLRDVRPYFYIR